MTLLKTKEYIDLVDLTHFLHENYGWASLGTVGSFHGVFSDALGELPSNGEMTFIEFEDEDSLEWYEENYSPEYAKVVEVFRKLIEDDHLPKRDTFEVYVWW